MRENGDSGAVDVLLVEDNPGDVRLTQEAFEEGRIPTTLRVVSDGVEALDFLYQRNGYDDAPAPAIVLLDLNLPRKNGQEVLTEMQDEPSLRRIPVIVLTSSDAHEDVVQCYELSANAYLRKSVDPDEFIEDIRSIETFWFSIVSLPDEVE